MEAVEIVSPPKVAKFQNGSQHLQPPSNTVKRSHSPDIQNFASLSPQKSPTRNPRSRKPKSKFDSDPDHDKPDSVVYISKSARPGSASAQVAPFSPKENLTLAPLQVKSNSRKKLRLSPPEPFSKSLVQDFVPSSLSDEDMVPKQISWTDPQVAKQNVDEWLWSTSMSSTERLDCGFDDISMDVDVDRPFPSPSSKPSPALVTSPSSTFFASTLCDHTPPLVNRPSSLSPLPSLPVVLDKDARSAQIIADIKAKAYAASMSSPLDSPPAQFKDELDDSSDEEDLFSFTPIKRKSESLSKMDLPEFKPPAPRRSGRYPFRNRERSPSPSTSVDRSRLSSASRSARATSSRGPVAPAQGQGKKQPKAKAYDPLEELLKEKRLADKRGKGDEAFRLAEVAFAGKDALLEEMNEEDWTNEDTARMAVAERERMEMKSSFMANDMGSDEMVLDAEDKQRLFGEERGKAIEDILDGDRAKTGKERENEKVFGVSLWSEGIPDLDDHMAIDKVVLVPDLTNSHPLVQLVKASVDCKDFAQAALILDSGAIASISLAEYPNVIPYFCELALSYQEDSLNTSIFRFLRHTWDSSSRPMPGISFACILACLVRIGARPSVIESMGWILVPGLRLEATGIQKRDDVLYRLVALVSSSARSRQLSHDEVPDILIAMLLIANEPSSSVELRREIMLAVDEVCQSIASGADISAPLESAICTSLLRYTSVLEPINKAFIVSVLEGGSGRTRRLAQWIAYAIITDNPTVAVKSYSNLPPLFPIYEQLIGRNDDEDVVSTPRKLELHQATDYVDMGFYVQILAVALSNVMAYVAKERKPPRPRPSTSGSPDNVDKSQPETMLELIVKAILALHSHISDTRAAHLERSRTKAALNGVGLRIHYQRLAGLRSSTAGTGKTRNLLQYFTPNG